MTVFDFLLKHRLAEEGKPGPRGTVFTLTEKALDIMRDARLPMARDEIEDLALRCADAAYQAVFKILNEARP